MNKKRHWLRYAGIAVIVGAVGAACGGSRFSASSDATGGGAGEGGEGTGGSSAGSSGSGAVSGSGGGGTTLCDDASDCDDGLPCTLDLCGELGHCEHPPKCTGDEPACCAGVCGQCCTPADCDDGVDCTADDCFAGFCTHTPTACPDPVQQYCSETGCRDRTTCEGNADCDDGNPCTTDVCADGRCDHESCGDGLHCCPGVGCSECCTSSQCGDVAGDDACNPMRCVDGECRTQPLCQGVGERCCERANGSADCGVGCCTLEDCPDIPCTRKLCTPAGCDYDPVAGDCPPGETCVVGEGCVPTAECSPSNPCPPSMDPCQKVTCNAQGRCEYSSACTNGTTCCPGIGCRECCSNAQCADASQPLCCPDGQCGQCCKASDCTAALNLPRIIGGSAPTGPGGACTVYECTPDHVCTPFTSTICRADLVCCPGVGCVPPGSCFSVD